MSRPPRTIYREQGRLIRPPDTAARRGMVEAIVAHSCIAKGYKPYGPSYDDSFTNPLIYTGVAVCPAHGNWEEIPIQRRPRYWADVVLEANGVFFPLAILLVKKEKSRLARNAGSTADLSPAECELYGFFMTMPETKFEKGMGSEEISYFETQDPRLPGGKLQAGEPKVIFAYDDASAAERFELNLLKRIEFLKFHNLL